MLDELENSVADELISQKPVVEQLKEVTISLIYPHWRAGTLYRSRASWHKCFQLPLNHLGSVSHLLTPIQKSIFRDGLFDPTNMFMVFAHGMKT
jgi:hypothetical protein